MDGSEPRWENRLYLAAGVALMMLALAGVVNLVVQAFATPEPPRIDLANVDPAVRAAIESAQAAVGRSPRSEDAWGRLGMVLAAHTFYAEAITCFAQAERLDPGEKSWPYFQGVLLTFSDGHAALPQT